MIARCLNKAPQDRFGSASAIVDALAADVDAGGAGTSARRWWRTHQLAIMGLYIVASTISWRIKEFFQTPIAVWLFIAMGVGSAIAGIIRGHLVFTAVMNGSRLDAERRRTGRVTLVVDLLIAAALAGDGLMLAPVRQLNAVFTLALALGIALARVLMEPATTAAAFGQPADER